MNILNFYDYYINTFEFILLYFKNHGEYMH
jgi:hypothetical protein